MPWTLQAYILRELLKTFALSVIALSVLFTLGGGVYNVMRYEGVTAGNLVHLLPMLMPIVLTITMPVAALFAATITYGRFAADNEFVACRAAGINVHGLFLPAVLLAVCVALSSMISTNVLIPQYTKNIEFYVRSNLRNYVFAKLRQSGYIERARDEERLIVTANGVRDVTDAALERAGYEPQSEELQYLWIERPTYLQIEEGRPGQFAVAEGALVMFDRRDGDMRIETRVRNLRHYEIGKTAVVVENPSARDFKPPLEVPERPAMAELGRLWRLLETPWELDRLRDAFERFTADLYAFGLAAHLGDRLRAGQTIMMNDPSGDRFSITAQEAAATGSEVSLRHLKVQRTSADSAISDFEAPRGRLAVIPVRRDAPRVRLEMLGDTGDPVIQLLPGAQGQRMRVSQSEYILDPLAAGPDELEAARPPAPNELVHGAPQLPERFAAGLADLRKATEQMRRKIHGLIHFRLSFACSALVTIVMGAVLGVIFRGSRILAAFGLACIPFATVALVILVGKNLIESSSGLIGVAVVWGGLGVAGLVDMGLLRLGVRR